jgi:hypothetical protein
LGLPVLLALCATHICPLLLLVTHLQGLLEAVQTVGQVSAVSGACCGLSLVWCEARPGTQGQVGIQSPPCGWPGTPGLTLAWSWELMWQSVFC